MGDSRVDGEGEAGSLGHGGRCLMGLLSHSWTHGGGRGTLDFGCSPGGGCLAFGCSQGVPQALRCGGRKERSFSGSCSQLWPLLCPAGRTG